MTNSPQSTVRLSLIFNNHPLYVWFYMKNDGTPFIVNYQGPIMQIEDLVRMVRTSYFPSTA